MRKLIVCVVSPLVVAVALFGQKDVVTFKKEVSSAFVWGQDSLAALSPRSRRIP